MEGEGVLLGLFCVCMSFLKMFSNTKIFFV